MLTPDMASKDLAKMDHTGEWCADRKPRSLICGIYTYPHWALPFRDKTFICIQSDRLYPKSLVPIKCVQIVKHSVYWIVVNRT